MTTETVRLRPHAADRVVLPLSTRAACLHLVRDSQLRRLSGGNRVGVVPSPVRPAAIRPPLASQQNGALWIG